MAAQRPNAKPVQPLASNRWYVSERFLFAAGNDPRSATDLLPLNAYPLTRNGEAVTLFRESAPRGGHGLHSHLWGRPGFDASLPRAQRPGLVDGAFWMPCGATRFSS